MGEGAGELRVCLHTFLLTKHALNNLKSKYAEYEFLPLTRIW